jgi:hypothetical protein
VYYGITGGFDYSLKNFVVPEDRQKPGYISTWGMVRKMDAASKTLDWSFDTVPKQLTPADLQGLSIPAECF